MSKISIVKEAAEKAIATESERTVHLMRKADTFAAGTIIITGFQLMDAFLNSSVTVSPPG